MEGGFPVIILNLWNSEWVIILEYMPGHSAGVKDTALWNPTTCIQVPTLQLSPWIAPGHLFHSSLSQLLIYQMAMTEVSKIAVRIKSVSTRKALVALLNSV